MWQMIIINENNINHRKHNKNVSHSFGYKTLNMMFRDLNKMSTCVFWIMATLGGLNLRQWLSCSRLVCVIGLEFTLCLPNLKYTFIE
jgi:hypothetical protein